MDISINKGDFPTALKYGIDAIDNSTTPGEDIIQRINTMECLHISFEGLTQRFEDTANDLVKQRTSNDNAKLPENTFANFIDAFKSGFVATTQATGGNNKETALRNKVAELCPNQK
ncbi:MAG: hypothetical protein GY804_06155 [Alphaproteobacteria bacterium]|nr:hypothetical protein [Alphaproteobacteria bacterium]